MACIILKNPASIEPVIWPSINSARSLSNPGRMLVQPERNQEVIQQQQSAEVEGAKQAELAQCRQNAFQEGLKQGREDALNEIQKANDRLAHTLRDLVALKRRLRNEAESDVVKLSLAIAKRILHRELNADPDSIQGVVYAGLQKLQNREITKVRICPAALDSVRTALEKAGIAPAVSIVPDPKLRNGDMIFETSLGDLDASIETQLQEIERGFADRLGIAC